MSALSLEPKMSDVKPVLLHIIMKRSEAGTQPFLKDGGADFLSETLLSPVESFHDWIQI